MHAELPLRDSTRAENERMFVPNVIFYVTIWSEKSHQLRLFIKNEWNIEPAPLPIAVPRTSVALSITVCLQDLIRKIFRLVFPRFNPSLIMQKL